VIVDLETREAARSVANLLRKGYVPHAPRTSSQHCALSAMESVRAPYQLFSMIVSVAEQDGFRGIGRWNDVKGKEHVIKAFEKIASET